MSEFDSSPKQHLLQKILAAVLRVYTHILFPVLKDLWRVLSAMLRPMIQLIARSTGSTLRNLHNKKHWTLRFRATLWGNAVGLAIAMIAAELITNFIEVRGIENMWGLFSQRTVVSDETFKILSFIAEFFIALVIFSIIEYFLDQRAMQKNSERHEDQDVNQDD